MQHKIRKLFLLMMGICILFCFGIFYIILQTKMEENVMEKEEYNRKTVVENYYKSFENLNSISHLLMLRSGVTRYLREESVTSSATKDAVQEVYDVLYTFDLPCYVTIFRKDRKYVNTGSGVMNIDVGGIYYSKWLEDVEEKNGGYVIKSNRENYFTIPTDKLITFVRQINDLNTQKPLGFLTINVSRRIFGTMYENLSSENNHFAVFDKSGYLIESDSKAFFIKDSQMKDKKVNLKPRVNINKGIFKESIIRYENIGETDFVLATWSEVDLWGGLSPKIVAGLVCGAVMISLCILYVNWYIINHITNPMMVEIDHLVNEQVQHEKNLQKAEMDALQEQIKPHFLYNTLDTIRYMVLEKQTEKVYDMLETLGNFYRRFLSKGSADIPLSEELEIVKSYLKLQKNRYEDVFEDEYEIEEGLGNIRVPRLILQPLVENSIYHGVRLKGEKGLIRIRVFKKENVLHIQVYDTGVGMSKEQIEALSEKKDSRSFGFKGTISRIQYYYKQEDVFEIRSEEGKYCEIELKLPEKEECNV